MASIDGAIWMKIHINLPQTTDVNISKGQPSRANGLGGVVSLRSKSPTILYFMTLLEKRPVFTRVKSSWLVIEVISPKNKIAIAKKSTYKAVFHWAGKIPAKCNSLYLLYHLYQNSFRRIFRVV